MQMKYLNLLGYHVVDRVTGFKGVVEAISYDLYGCVQCIVRPEIDDKGKMDPSAWFDAQRLNISKEHVEEPVMPPPSFAMDTGAAEKPAR